MPSAAITAALTSLYAVVRDVPRVRAAIAGIMPATVGLGLLLGYSMLRPLMNSARRQGAAGTLIAATLLLGSTVATLLTRAPVPAILWLAGGLSAFAQWQLAARRGPQ